MRNAALIVPRSASVLAVRYAQLLVGQVRHLEAGVAADEDAARDGGIAVALAHLVDGVVERDGVAQCSLERQLQLLRALAVDVGHRETDQRQPALGDQRRGRRDQAACGRRG